MCKPMLSYKDRPPQTTITPPEDMQISRTCHSGELALRLQVAVTKDTLTAW